MNPLCTPCDWQAMALSESLSALEKGDFDRAKQLQRFHELLVEKNTEIGGLKIALAESQANDRCGMGYLARIREAIGGEDFPDMCERVELLVELRGPNHEELEQCRIIGMGAERELALMAKVERQAKLIEQCKEALAADNSKLWPSVLRSEALAAIEKELAK